MGWPSYFENLVEKFDEEKRAMLTRADWRARDYELPRDLLERWIAKFRGVVRELQDYVALASDPDVDLAMRVRGLERDNGDLRGRLRALEQELHAAREAAAEARKAASRAEAEAAAARSGQMKLQAVLDRAFASDPDLLYRAYGSEPPGAR